MFLLFCLVFLNKICWSGSLTNPHQCIQNTVPSKEGATTYQECVYKQRKVIWTCERRGICALHAASVLCWPWMVVPENTQDMRTCLRTPSIHPFSLALIQHSVTGSLDSIPRDLGQKVGDILLPRNHKVQSHTWCQSIYSACLWTGVSTGEHAHSTHKAETGIELTTTKVWDKNAKPLNPPITPKKCLFKYFIPD